MSKTKAGGSKASQHISPKGKRLGVKTSAGQSVSPGFVLVRQVGAKIHSGEGTKMGRDFSIISVETGIVEFYTKEDKKFVKINKK